MNPLIADWTSPFQMPPFGAISDEDFEPAFDAAFEQARNDVKNIAENSAPATFSNTIEAMEKDSDLLDRVGSVFFNLASADTNEAREAIQRDLSPRYAAFHSETMMNADLFRRVKAVFESDEALTDEQRVVTEKYYKMFVRAGANLDGEKRDRFKAVMQRLAELGTTFSQNVLAEERGWDLTLEEADLDGLPDFLISALKSSAEARDKTGYLLTLTPSLIGPFLQFSTRRDLREAVTAAWKARGANGGDHDNRDVIKETLALRAERAQILGYADFASFKLEEEMAKTPGAVRELLEAVWEPAKTRAEQDAVILAQMMKDDGINDAFRPSDWHYYAEKRKQAEHDLDEAELKPYLPDAFPRVWPCASFFVVGCALSDDFRHVRRAGLCGIAKPELNMRHAAPHFQHVFSGDGYSSGYYSYMWSEVMDADAFEAFEETGNAFDPATAEKLEKWVYSAGGSRDPAELYVAFRGAMPSVAALLKGRGLAA